MSLSLRLQRIEDKLTAGRRTHSSAAEAEAQALWRAGLELLSLEELNRIEPIIQKIIEDTERCGVPELCWMHELLDEPCLSAAEREELILIFLTMGFDLVAMASAGVPQ